MIVHEEMVRLQSKRPAQRRVAKHDIGRQKSWALVIVVIAIIDKPFNAVTVAALPKLFAGTARRPETQIPRAPADRAFPSLWLGRE